MTCPNSVLYCRDVRDLKAQLSSTSVSSQQEAYQSMLQDRDAARSERDKLLGDILQLQKETGRLRSLEQQHAAAVKLLFAAAECACNNPCVASSGMWPCYSSITCIGVVTNRSWWLIGKYTCLHTVNRLWCVFCGIVYNASMLSAMHIFCNLLP